MPTPIRPVGKKREEPPAPQKRERRKTDGDGFCDCICHDVKGVMHVMACCDRCGEMRPNPNPDRKWGDKKEKP